MKKEVLYIGLFLQDLYTPCAFNAYPRCVASGTRIGKESGIYTGARWRNVQFVDQMFDHDELFAFVPDVARCDDVAPTVPLLEPSPAC